MRPVLRLIGSRYGMALVLVVLVLAVVGAVRGLAGSNPQTLGVTVEPSTATSIDPTAGDDSVVTTTSDSPQPPVTSPGAPDPNKVATAFMAGWLTHDGVTPQQWRSSFARYATPALLEQLKDTDPAVVPAQRTTGAVAVQNRSQAYVEAAIPVDSGTVRLRMLAVNGRWLVDGIDWDRA
ncbi:MAG: hypothetical protein QOI74_3877 [Micromonosporaceae bacterium]|jgi:hypothetical protein|nr:hypothetical protein [Micromonosporaceae bacterium]MDT5038599.1 hypothetical protein [Micromonosporaceae bacterium]